MKKPLRHEPRMPISRGSLDVPYKITSDADDWISRRIEYQTAALVQGRSLRRETVDGTRGRRSRAQDMRLSRRLRVSCEQKLKHIPAFKAHFDTCLDGLEVDHWYIFETVFEAHGWEMRHRRNV